MQWRKILDYFEKTFYYQQLKLCKHNKKKKNNQNAMWQHSKHPLCEVASNADIYNIRTGALFCRQHATVLHKHKPVHIKRWNTGYETTGITKTECSCERTLGLCLHKQCYVSKRSKHITNSEIQNIKVQATPWKWLSTLTDTVYH